MGCGASTAQTERKGSVSAAVVTTGKGSYTSIINEKSPHIRLDQSIEMRKAEIDCPSISYSLEYCYVSQRGYYPQELTKPNQDSYMICEHILADPNTFAFGVFDGHGKWGDLCSHMAAEKFPMFLELELKDKGGADALQGPNMEQIYTKACLRTNKYLHRADFDTSYSGTTAITVVVNDGTLYVGNIGDSRAILACRQGDSLKYKKLSQDQTPFRKDERERLKKEGAIIRTLSQLDQKEPIHENWGTELGEEVDEVGDPPRVWDASEEVPGCAFSRSYGDSVAESIGVNAEPEILVHDIQPEDELIIIASDGVFEFITSQACVDIIASFPNKLEAAKKVVSQAYSLWLTYDDRTDDISIIIIEISKVNRKIKGKHIEMGWTENPEKPVRRVMSKAKRQSIQEAASTMDDSAPFDFSANETVKTGKELSRLFELTKTDFLFQHLSMEQKQQIFRVMRRISVVEGDQVICEGDAGEDMYFIDSGEFHVHKVDSDGQKQLVFTYTTPGSSFGELSLMYGKPRAASISARSDGVLWSIGRQAYRAVQVQKHQSNLLQLLQRVPVLADSSPIQLQRLCSSISECVLQDGELIFSAQGDKEKYILCIVSSGVIIMGNMKCGPGKCILSDQIGADCVGKASGVSKVLTLPRESVLAVLGADGNAALLAAVGRGEKSSKKKSKSILDDSSGKKLGSFDTNDLLISDRTVSLGDFGYIGTTKNFDRRVSIKVYAKATLNESRLAEKIVAERNILAALRGKALCITDAVSSAQDERFIYLTLGDHFQCDLSTVLSETTISTDAKYYYAACAASAILALFDFGLFHRFINTSSLYITSSGVLKVADLRYARRMDGSRCLTVCGDPLYFAPEQVRQSGYDYAIDLWALGVLIYELFEGANPFGSEKTGETDIFKIISAFEPSILAFSEKTPDEVRDIIRLLMTEQDHKRLGYTDPGDLSRHSFFRANPLSSVGDKNKEGYPTDVACDVMDINPSDVPSFSSPIFEKF